MKQYLISYRWNTKEKTVETGTTKGFCSYVSDVAPCNAEEVNILCDAMCKHYGFIRVCIIAISLLPERE